MGIPFIHHVASVFPLFLGIESFRVSYLATQFASWISLIPFHQTRPPYLSIDQYFVLLKIESTPSLRMPAKSKLAKPKELISYFSETEVQTYFIKTAEEFRRGIQPLHLHGLEVFHPATMLAEEALHPTALGGIAILVATWKDFGIYLFLDNEQNNTQQEFADSGSNFWFGFHHEAASRIFDFVGSLPKHLRALNVYNDNKAIPLSYMRNILIESYPHDGAYFGVWDLSGYDKTPVNISRAVDFIKSVVTSEN